MSINPQPVPGKTFLGLCQSASVFGRSLFKARSQARLLQAGGLSVVAAILASQSANAATIIWGTPATIAGDTDVNGSGAALYAYSGGVSAGTTNLNGVTFSAGSGFAAWGSVSFTSGFTSSSGTAFGVAASPFQDLSTNYQTVLRGGAFGGATAGTVTLNGLTPGNDYQVQIWVNDTRSAGNGRTETINGTTVTLDYNNYDGTGGVGQYVIGVFTADSTNQAFAMTPSPSGTVQVNAISVRDEGLPQRTWVGASGNSWGTAGNWSPAVVPFPGDSVTFNASSTGSLGTILDTNYIVGTVVLSNAPGAVSIGSDGNTLTINGGINVFGAGDQLTIGDAVVLGTFQNWTNNGTVTVNSGVSGSAALTIAGSGVVNFTQPATYLYKTTIGGGTLALSGSASLTSANITVAGGAKFDVSALSSQFTFNGVTLSNSSAEAVLSGSSDCSSGTISITYDGVNPAFIQTNGTLTLSSSTVINLNIPGTVLGGGTYTIIKGATTGNAGLVGAPGGLPSVTLTGNGAVAAASLQIISGDLQLVVAAPDAWTGAGGNNLWTTAGNWNPAVAPNFGDSVLFNSSSTANLGTILGADEIVLGVTVIDPTGPVSIGGANSLTVYGNGLNLSAASQTLTISSPMVLNANQNWNVTNSRTLTISGPVTTVSGANVTVTGGGTVQMGANNVLTGLTNASPGAGDFTVNSTLDLKGTSQAINGLNGSGVVDNTAGGPATLTVGGNNDNSIFSGIIKNTSGALQLQVAGGDVQLLATNTYSGGTVFNGGTLYFPNSSPLGTGPVTFNPGSGTYTVGRTFTNALTLNGGYLRVGGANLNVQNWSGPTTIINGFQMAGDAGSGGITLSGPINIGTSGISITNFGGNGPTEGSGVSTTGDLLSGAISGSGGITYYVNGGTSRLTVQGANTYSGGTIVNGTPDGNGNGKLNVWGGTSPVSGFNPFSTGSVTLNVNAIIEAAPNAATVTNALILNGGTLESECQFNNFNQLTWSGPITLTADSALFQQGTKNSTGTGDNQSSGVNVNGPLNINGFTLGCYGNFTFFGGHTINGSISGAGTIVVTNNTLNIAGSNTFSGTFRAVGGTLTVNNAFAMQNATLDMNVADLGAVNLNNLNHTIGALTGTRNLSLGSGSVSIGKNNTTTTYDGILTGGASLTKIGSGTLTLSGANSYSGSTTVNGGTLAFTGATTYSGNTTVNTGGTLSISQPNLAFASTVTVASGAILDLNFMGTNVITALVLNGVSKPNGLYNSGNSGGLITGTGVIQVGATPEVWTGALSSEWSTNILSSPFNWKYNGVGNNYADGGAVLFDDSSANTNVNISLQNVLPVGVNFNNTTNNYTLQGSFGIAGSASLTKSGSNTLTLLNPNAFTGNMAINGGKVTVASGGSLGATYVGGISIATNSTFEYSSASATLSGAVTGAGSIILDSASTCQLTLSGANTYSGTTTISNAANPSIRIISPATSVSTNTTFNIAGSSTSGGQFYINSAGTILNNMTISGVGYADTGFKNGAIRLANGANLSGTITLAGNSRIGYESSGNGASTISGQLTGTGALDFSGVDDNQSAAWTMTFTLANTGTSNNYNGNTSILNNFGNGFSTTSFTVVKLGANEQIPNGPSAGILSFQNGNNANRQVVFELNGFNETINGLANANAGAFTIIRNTSTGASTLTIGDGNTNSTYSGTIADSGAGKTLAITKTGLGTLTLSASNTYNGGTAVNGGTLLINNTTGTGTGTNAVNINNGGTLGGTGIILGLVTNKSGGTLYAGTNGIGKLTLNGNVTLLAGSTNTFAVNGTTPTNNSVAVGAAITYGGVLNIVTNGAFSVGQKFTLFSGAGATNTSNFASITGSPGSGKSFSFTNGVLSVITPPSGPTLTSVSPNPATGSSYQVTLSLTGTGFTGVTAVLLTNLTTSTGASYVPTVNSSTSISVNFVPGTAASTWNATVVNGTPSGQVGFTVAAPTRVSINAANLNSAGAGKLVLSGTGGAAGNSYSVQSATNLNPPVVWTSVVTNVFGAGGSFGYTNTMSPATPSLFLRIQQ